MPVLKIKVNILLKNAFVDRTKQASDYSNLGWCDNADIYQRLFKFP